MTSPDDNEQKDDGSVTPDSIRRQFADFELRLGELPERDEERVKPVVRAFGDAVDALLKEEQAVRALGSPPEKTPKE